jgi:hypothetical protein
VDLRAMELGFPLEVPAGIGQLIADFSATAKAIAVVVSVEQVIRDAPREG